MKQLYARVGIVPALIILLFLFPIGVGAQDDGGDQSSSASTTEAVVSALTITESVVDSSGSVVTLTASDTLVPRNIDGSGGFAVDQEGVAVSHVIVHNQRVMLTLSQTLPEGVVATISYTAPDDDTKIVDTGGSTLGSGLVAEITYVVQDPEPVVQQTPQDETPVVEPQVAPVQQDETPVEPVVAVEPQVAPVVAPTVEAVWLTSYVENSGNVPTGDAQDHFWIGLGAVGDPRDPSSWGRDVVYEQGSVITLDDKLFASNIAKNTGNHPLSRGHYYEHDGSWVTVDTLPAWQDSVVYAAGDLVVDTGAVYRRTGVTFGGERRPSQKIVPSSVLWDAVQSYEVGDTVEHDGIQYESIVASNVGNQPTEAAIFVRTSSDDGWVSLSDLTAWDGETAFATGDQVAHNGKVFQSRSGGNTGNEPSGSEETTHYQRANGTHVAVSDIVSWSNEVEYVTGDLVVYEDVVYRATVDHVNLRPSDEETSWEKQEGVAAFWESIPTVSLWRSVPQEHAWIPVGSVTPWSPVLPDAWNEKTAYTYGDVVLHNEKRYLSANNTGHNPRSAEKGDVIAVTIVFSEAVASVPALTFEGVVLDAVHRVVEGKSVVTGFFLVPESQKEKTFAVSDVTVDGVSQLPDFKETVVIGLGSPETPTPMLSDGSLIKGSGEGVSYRHPSYTVVASDPGVLTFSGDGCSLEDQIVSAGSVTIALSLGNGEYDCAISLRTDAGGVSEPHSIPTFTVDGPEGVLLRNPAKEVSVKERKERVSFTVDVEHWFSDDDKESLAIVTISGPGLCKHLNDRLLRDGEFFVKREEGQTRVEKTHEVRSARLDEGTYENCAFRVNGSDPIAIKDFTIEVAVVDEPTIQGPDLPSDKKDESTQDEPKIQGPDLPSDAGTATQDEPTIQGPDLPSNQVSSTVVQVETMTSQEELSESTNDSSSAPAIDPTKPIAPQIVTQETDTTDSGNVASPVVSAPETVAVVTSALPVGNSVTLRKGVVLEPVRALQRFLNSRGGDFLVAAEGPGSPGNETNVFGDATDAAVRVFQEAQGAAVTGEVIVYIDDATDTVTFVAPFVDTPTVDTSIVATATTTDTEIDQSVIDAEIALIEQQIEEITKQIQEQMSTNPDGNTGASQ